MNDEHELTRTHFGSGVNRRMADGNSFHGLIDEY